MPAAANTHREPVVAQREFDTAGKNIVIFGLYSTNATIENGMRALKAAGFRNTDISVFMPQNVGPKDLGISKATKAPEGAAAGGIAGALIDMGTPEYEAKRYEGRIRSGGILLSVHCDDSERTKRTKEILEISGASDISTTREVGADYAKTDRPLPRGDTGGTV